MLIFELMDASSNRRYFLICLILGLVTFFVFYQVHSFKFITYDDPSCVYKNPDIQSGITLQSIKWAFTTGWTANWIPLTWLSYMLDWQLFGSNPAGYHVINLIFHIINTLLVFIVLGQMTRSIWPSAFAAALFALHPLHIQSVAWVSERKDILSTFFWMLTMWAYLRYVNKPGISRYLWTVFFLTLGLMSKPMLVTLPFVLLLLDYWPLERFRRRTLLYLIGEKIPFLVLSAASSVITFLVQQSSMAVVSLNALPLKFRILNAFISYIGYIEKMFWPSHVAVFYPHLGPNLSIPHAIISGGLLLAATVLVIRFAKNHRYLVTGWFWYIGTLVPVIGFIQVGIQGMADRYSYIPLTGLFIIIAWGVPDLLAKWRYKKIVLVSLALLILSTISICTYKQLRYWRNTLTLFQHAIDVTKDNFMAMNELAWYLAVDPKITVHNPYRAIELAKESCKIVHYRDPGNLDTLAVAYAAAGNFNKAIEITEKALELCQSFDQGMLKKELESRLILYKAGKPYIENEQ
jgi:protein O-mannosyl-transferase